MKCRSAGHPARSLSASPFPRSAAPNSGARTFQFFQSAVSQVCATFLAVSRCRPALCAVALFFVVIVHGDPPPLDGLYPAGGERGTTNTVMVAGKFDAWPPKVWINESGLTFTAETNRGKFP